MKMNKYQAIWLTGQTASGKTTLANLILKSLSKDNNLHFNIDGDDLRDLIKHSLDPA